MTIEQEGQVFFQNLVEYVPIFLVAFVHGTLSPVESCTVN